MLTDNPANKLNDDAYGFRPYIESLNEMVLAADRLPVTVGVFGPWGSGKSSFLGMWHNLLAGAPRRIERVWFNPWKYDQKVEVWAALIHTILAKMRESDDEHVRNRTLELIRTATALALRSAVSHGVALGTAGAVNAGTVQSIFDAVGKSDADLYRDINRFDHDFAEAVNEYVGEGGRLVVFVDDLDRCTPEAAVTVLEALKLFIGDANCVFVLAMDFDLLAAVATKKFGEHAPVAGAYYLEKIVQVPFFLPAVSLATVRSAVGAAAGDLNGSEAFWELVEVGLGANPRRVKRYLNVLNIASGILSRTASKGSLDLTVRLQLAELLIIRSEHRTFFHHIVRDPSAWSRLETIRTEKGNNGQLIPVHERDNDLREFLTDAALMRLLSTRPGGYLPHPAAPAPATVRWMLETVLVTTGPVEEDSAARLVTGGPVDGQDAPG